MDRLLRAISLLAGLWLPVTIALIPLPQGPSWAGSQKDAICGGGCGGGCGPCPNAAPGAQAVPSGPTPEQIETERVKRLKGNIQAATTAFENGDYEAAARHFREALKYSPHNPTLEANLQKVLQKAEEVAATARRAAIERDEKIKAAEKAALERAKEAAARNKALEELRAVKESSEQAASNSTTIVLPRPQNDGTFDRRSLPATSSPGASASKEARQGFDEGMSFRSPDRLRFWPRSDPPFIVPPESLAKLKNDPRWQALQEREKRLEAEQSKYDAEIARIESDLQKGKGDKGQLEVKLVEARKKQDDAKHEMDALVVETRSFVIDFTEQPKTK